MDISEPGRFASVNMIHVDNMVVSILFIYAMPQLCLALTTLSTFKIIIASNLVSSQMKQMRKEVADLLRSGKEENARIRVEAVIREINLLQVSQLCCNVLQGCRVPAN